MKLLSIGTALALAALGASAVASGQSVPLQLTVFPCAADSAAPPSLSAWDWRRAPSVKIQPAPSWQRIGAIWQGSLTLAPGRYMLYADSPHCSGSYVHWVGIPGEQRHLTLTINKLKSGTLVDGLHYGLIYGYLPAPSATVEVMRADSLAGEQTRRPVPTDGDTYQIANLTPGQYVVRVTFGGVVTSRDVTLGRTSDTFTVRADLTPADAARMVDQQAAGSRFVYVKNDQDVRMTRLVLGAASANGWTTEPLPPTTSAGREPRS